MNFGNSRAWTWDTEPRDDPYGLRGSLVSETPARKKKISDFDYEILAGLLRKVYDAPSLEERVRDLESRLAVQEQLMAQLFTPPPQQHAGSFEDWLETVDAEQYAGTNVIYVIGQGVVKSAKDLSDLVGDKRLSIAGVVLGYVPGS